MSSSNLAPLSVALLSVVLLSACTSTPEATVERDAEAKRFEPVTRDAVIYVYRPDLSALGGTTALLANGRIVGTSFPGTYFRIIVLAGRAVLETYGSDAGRIEVQTRGNDVVYIEMRTDGGGDNPPQTRFRRLPPEIAQAAILHCCSMLETWRPGQPRFLLW